ncbi:MAG TPA: VCBS repeat-containing protein [Bacteroidales bacterium]|nr:VCBS repeat-containing protein [Bacteroidales bacterium]
MKFKLYKITRLSRLVFLMAIFSVSPWFYNNSFSQTKTFPSWTHFSIDPVLPGSGWGTGGAVLSDFDHDGDPDVAISRRDPREAYWYERRNDSLWIPHIIAQSDNLVVSLGSIAIDIDHDGWTDALSNGVWFRNPGVLDKYPDAPWTPFNIKAGGHDIVSADLDNNGVEDIVVYDGNKIAWYNTSNSLRETVINSGNNDHGGIAPHGFGDLDGDNDLDVVIPEYWFENPGKGTGNWIQHKWPYSMVPNASYGRSIKAWIADINKDGNNDIIYSDCDTGGGHVYWLENRNGDGTTWIVHKLEDPPTKKGDVPGTGSFHSLGVADFNNDGNPDIFAGEQEDPDTYMEDEGKIAMKPRGLKERGVIYYNNGKKEPEFSISVIHIDNPGWHDAQMIDVDKDGDIDIVSKIWNADGPVYHLDYWRNELIKK